MKKVSILVMLVLASMAVVVAGCGSSDDSSGPARDEYIAQADKICEKSDTEIAAMGKSLSARPSKEETLALIKTDLLPALESRAKALEALERPSADADELESYYQDVDDGISTVADDPEAIFKPGADDPFKAANDAAKKYGFKVCGTNV